MTVLTTGAIARQLGVDRDRVCYAVRKLSLKPVGTAGHFRLFSANAPKQVQEFLERQRKKEKVSA